MAGEFFRTERFRAVLGIRRVDLDKLLVAAGTFSVVSHILDEFTEPEPLTRSLRDLGYTDVNSTPPMLAVEIVAGQIDAGLNEIPRATCSLAVGRDGFKMAAGAADEMSTAVGHLLEPILAQHVPARIYGIKSLIEAGGADGASPDGGDTEPLLLFEGFVTAPNRRHGTENAALVVHLAHFTAALTFSSSASALTTPGSHVPVNGMPTTFPIMTSGIGFPATVYGATTATMSATCYTDFWGFQIPSSPLNGGQLPQDGVKGFLTRLALNPQPGWATIQRAPGARECANADAALLYNNRAAYALSRIEPFWPDWDAVAGGGLGAFAGAGRALAASQWAFVRSGLDTARTLLGGGAAARNVNRADLLAVEPQAYGTVGYRYGMPIQMYLDDRVLGVLPLGRGFAADIAGATFTSLNPHSFWDLLVHQYPARYQIALAPMADRAVVLPSQPLLSEVWQTVYASEIWDFDDDVQTPVPVQGVILVGQRSSLAGAFPAGTQPIEAVYDSCIPGQFPEFDMPEWLANAVRMPGAYSNNINQARMAAGLPAALAAVVGVGAAAAVNFPTLHQALANRIAKALWQREYLRYRSLSVTGRLRFDIGPGSVIAVEVPDDRYVQNAYPIGAGRATRLTGMVARVTMSFDAEHQTGSTAFQLAFVRTDAELQVGQPLYAGGHPFWGTATLGVPWCDSDAVRTKLGNKASIG